MESIESLVSALAEACLQKNRRIATVESCTGGMIAAACTDLGGSSAWFERGWVTYSNEAKIDGVGVTHDTLMQHGAVSEQTACEMAVGGLVHSRADVCVAVTGIAGPTGATLGKPIGHVCFAWAVRGKGVRAETKVFTGDRAAIRRAATQHALAGLLNSV